jgi:hypothetical protein
MGWRAGRIVVKRPSGLQNDAAGVLDGIEGWRTLRAAIARAFWHTPIVARRRQIRQGIRFA